MGFGLASALVGSSVNLLPGSMVGRIVDNNLAALCTPYVLYETILGNAPSLVPSVSTCECGLSQVRKLGGQFSLKTQADKLLHYSPSYPSYGNLSFSRPGHRIFVTMCRLNQQWPENIGRKDMPIWGICTADIVIYHYLHGFIISSTRGQDSSTPIVTGALICSHFQVFSAPNSKPEVSVKPRWKGSRTRPGALYVWWQSQ